MRREATLKTAALYVIVIHFPLACSLFLHTKWNSSILCVRVLCVQSLYLNTDLNHAKRTNGITDEATFLLSCSHSFSTSPPPHTHTHTSTETLSTLFAFSIFLWQRVQWPGQINKVRIKGIFYRRFQLKGITPKAKESHCK